MATNSIIFGDTGTNYVPIQTDPNGNLNVNIISGGGGGGGLVQIQGYNGTNWENINVLNGSVNTNITNQTIDTNITNETIDTNITNQISNYALETNGNLEEIRNKTDNLTFFENGTITELRVFDIQNNVKLDAIETYTSKLNDLTYTDNKLNVNIDNAITNYSLESGGNLSTVATNTDKLKFIGDDLKTVISNTGFNVNNQITNFSTETKQDTQIEELEKVVDKKGDIEAEIYYDQGEIIWVDSVPILAMNERDPNGWLYLNENNGNAMNLYYFNGNNETKTLSQVVGQYCVVSNLSTKLNNSLIFTIYTKGSPFYTTRITHTPINTVNLTAGGKFLCYWGAVPADIYPNLPRLNFTDTQTTGPAIPTEEILSVSLNTNSATPAGDIYIFVESLGVVFNNGSVNQSRVLKLLSNKTEYSLTADNTEFNQLTYTYLSNLNKTNGGLDAYIVNSNIAISNTSFEISNFPASQNSFITNDALTPVPITGEVSVSGNVNVNVSNVSPISISGIVDVNSLPAINITNTGFNVNNPITNFSLESGGNLSTVATNTNKLKFIGDDLKTVISNTGFNVNNPITNYSLETGGNLATVATNTDKLKFIGDDLKTIISNTGFDVNNQITNFSLESGGNLATVATNTDKLKFIGDDLKTIISNTGFNVNNQLTNFSLESGGNLAGIKTNTDKNTYTTGNLNVNVASGSISVSSVNIKDSSGNNLNSTSNALNTYLTNTSVDSHCYASSNGTNWHHLSSDANGQLNIHSKTQDGAGNDITSTLNGTNKQSLDVNVANSGNIGVSVNNTVSISGTVAFSNTSIGISGTASVADSTSQGYLNTINQGVGYAYIEGTPVPNATIAGNTIGTYGTWTRGQYRKTVFNYSDGNTANTDSISIYSRETPSNNGVMIATFYPYVVASSRQYSGVLELGAFNAIAVRNNSASSISGVSLKLFSS